MLPIQDDSKKKQKSVQYFCNEKEKSEISTSSRGNTVYVLNVPGKFALMKSCSEKAIPH